MYGTAMAVELAVSLGLGLVGVGSAFAARAVLAALVVSFRLSASHDQRIPLLAAIVGAVVALAVVAWRHRRPDPVVVLAHRYGLVRAQ